MPLALRAHQRQHRAGQGEQSEHIGVELGAYLLLDDALIAITGIIYQDINSAKFVDRRALTASVIAASLVTSSANAVTCCTSRAVITARQPRDSTRCASSRPNPVEQPVINHTGIFSADIMSAINAGGPCNRSRQIRNAGRTRVVPPDAAPMRSALRSRRAVPAA